MKRLMIFEMGRSSGRLCCLHRLGWVTLVLAASIACASAQGFEEVPVSADNHLMKTGVSKSIRTDDFVSQPLPAIVSPNDVSQPRPSTAVVHAFGNVSPGGVVLAQFQEEPPWTPNPAYLPSVRLVQGDVPRVASIEKTAPQTSVYQGPGRIITDESDGMTPTVTTRPPTRTLPPPPQITGNPRSSVESGIVNTYTPPNEFEWDDTGIGQSDESYETLPKQLGRVSGYGSELMPQDMYGTPYDPYHAAISGNVYGQGIPGNGMYAANGYDGYYGYGQGMYGYDYGAYPGTYPMYSHGLASGIFSHIIGSSIWENLTLGFGGAGFKSPLDFQNGGAFGFTETLNWASPSTSMSPVRLQAGVRAVQAYPSGYVNDYGNWHHDSREQYFGTAGLFQRNIGGGPLNFGVVYDMMSDKYYNSYQLEQLRTELSCGGISGIEFGYRGAFGLRNDSLLVRNHPVDIRVMDYHTLFLKKYFANGGEGSLAGGATEYGDWVIRAEYSIPLSNEWGLKNSLSYMIPQGGHSPASPTRESWDVSLQLVYQPRCGMLAGFCNPFRAFFDVADNGTLLYRPK